MKKIFYTTLTILLFASCKETPKYYSNLITVDKKMEKADSGWYEDYVMVKKVSDANGTKVYYDNPMYVKK